MSTEVTVRGKGGGFVQTIEAGALRFAADEPRALGGTDAGPSPYELLLGALGACTSMTVGLYARNKGWPLGDIAIKLKHERVHQRDCAECFDQPRKLERITVELELGGPLSDEQRARLREIAARCPVHRTLTSHIELTVQ